jgi:hypothetical protein
MIPKLNDDASNWVDYKSKALLGIGLRGLMAHIKGCAVRPKPYATVSGVVVLADGKTEASEDQIETREKRIDDFETKEYLARHIMVNSVSMRLAQQIKDEPDPKKMWEAIVEDAESKGTLYLVNLQKWIHELKCQEGGDVKAHLTELTAMNQDLASKGVVIPNDDFTTIIMSSLPANEREAAFPLQSVAFRVFLATSG